jgi:hypothetical protein
MIETLIEIHCRCRMWSIDYEKRLQLVLRFLANERDELLELRARVRASENAVRAKRGMLIGPSYPAAMLPALDA